MEKLRRRIEAVAEQIYKRVKSYYDLMNSIFNPVKKSIAGKEAS